MAIKKYVTWAIAAFVIFYLLRSPENAAQVVQNAASGLPGCPWAAAQAIWGTT